MLSGVTIEATVTSYDPGIDLALAHVNSAGADLPAAPLAAARPAAGAIATAASRWNGTDFITPVFVAAASSSNLSISGAGYSLAPGTPLYNGDGELFGVTASPDRPGAAFFVPEVVARLRSRQAAGLGHPSALGVAFQPIDARLSPWFGGSGAIVVQVIQGAAADIAGIKAGDVLTGLGGQIVDSPGTAQSVLAAMAAGTRAVAQLVRDGEPLTLEVTLGSALEALTLRTDEPLQTPAGEVSARDLFGAADLGAAGISADARILRINDRLATTVAQSRRDVQRAAGPVLLYVQDEGRRYFATGAVSP
jgi:S1-C subfamily serine protease